jgi:hypothetical protein
MWLLSPETSQQKFKESLELLGFRVGTRGAFREWVDSDPGRRWLKARVKLIRETGIREVIIENWKAVLADYEKERAYLSPRAQRDWPRLLYLIKAYTLLNCFNRKRVGDSIYAIQDDYKAALALHGKVAKSNELGLSPETYEIYLHVIQPLATDDLGIDRKSIQKGFFELYHRPLSDQRLRRDILPSLESAGLVAQEADPKDKRRMLVWCTIAAPISSDSPSSLNVEKYRGQNSAPSELPFPEGENLCEICQKPGMPISRIGEDGVRTFCSEHLSKYSGDL